MLDMKTRAALSDILEQCLLLRVMGLIIAQYLQSDLEAEVQVRY